MKTTPLHSDQRGVSFTLQFILGLAILISISGILVTGIGDIADNREDLAAEQERDYVADTIISHLDNTEAIITNEEPTELESSLTLPDTITGDSYQITVEQTESNTVAVTVTSSTGSTTQETTLNDNDIDAINTFTGSGGDLTFTYDQSSNELTITHATTG